MRIDLTRGGNRKWWMRLGLTLVRWRLGVVPAPPLTISYRPDLFDRDFVGYVLRAVSGQGPWNKGEAELFATFVSDLNSCHF